MSDLNHDPQNIPSLSQKWSSKVVSDIARPLWLKHIQELAHTFSSYPVLIPQHTSCEQYIHLPFQLAACFPKDHAKWWVLNRHLHRNPTERVNPTDGWQFLLWPEILKECIFYTVFIKHLGLAMNQYWIWKYTRHLTDAGYLIPDPQLCNSMSEIRAKWFDFLQGYELLHLFNKDKMNWIPKPFVY